jgi:lipopolysaccharide transport system permease protein
MGYWREVWRLRNFWLAMVRADLRNRYRRTLIGLGWSLLQPIAMSIVLCTVFSQVFHAQVDTYGPFVLAGLTTWGFVAGVITQGCNCFFQGESYIRQHPAPLAIYPLRVALGASVHFLLGVGVVIAASWCFHGFGNLAALPSLIPTLVLLVILGWALAVCMGVLNVLFQDVQHLAEVGLQIVFYLTPIIYSANLLNQRKLGWALSWNPLAAFLDLVRQPILDGVCPSPHSFALAGLATLAAALVAMLVLRRMEHRVIFYL